MYNINTIFKQILDFVPKSQFNQFVGQHNADKYTKRFSCWQQFMTMMYAQASNKTSLRDIEVGLRAQHNKWYHLGINSIARSTISYANNNRPYQIFEDLFYYLLKDLKNVSSRKNFRFKNPIYSFDSSTIRLALDIFPWAYYQRSKGAIKIHTMLNNRTIIPEFIVVTDGKVQDMVAAREAELNLPKYSILAMDKGYIDLKWFKRLNDQDCFFVTRIKKNMVYEILEEEKRFLGKGILKSEIIRLSSRWGKARYPDKLRLVTYYDEKHREIYKFFTNNFKLAPKTIANIYKARWEIEVFFRWIKQNLRIKSFLGTSKNAVLSQIWIAMIYYLLVAFISSKAKEARSLLEFTRILRELLMERLPMVYILGVPHHKIDTCKNKASPQLSLF